MAEKGYAFQVVPMILARFFQVSEKLERATDIQPSVLPIIVITLHWKDGVYLRMTPDPNFQPAL